MTPRVPFAAALVPTAGSLEVTAAIDNLLNLLAAIALLVWGTHIVRTGVLRVYGAACAGSSRAA